MIEESDFETFLYVSKNKLQIIVFDNIKFENLYSEILITNNEFDFKELSSLPKFLDEHIYKIEKLVGNFINNIILIIESEENLNVNIGIKKKNNDNLINQKYLKNNLTELKDIFIENYQEQTIMHVIILAYIVDEERYSSFKNDFNSDNLSLEVNFVSISNELVNSLNNLLSKYQVKISQFMCGNYIKSFLDEDNIEISLMAHKLINGFNDNEAIIIPKNTKNKGFFEKFFQLFN